jgi:hypothetical protein
MKNVVKIERRSFLKSALGATLALPFLESLYSGPAYGQSEAYKFGVFIRQPSGVMIEAYWPAAAGALNEASMKGGNRSFLSPNKSSWFEV